MNTEEAIRESLKQFEGKPNTSELRAEIVDMLINLNLKLNFIPRREFDIQSTAVGDRIETTITEIV